MLFQDLFQAALGRAGCAGTAKQGLTSVRCELRTGAFACDFFKWEKCHPNFSYHARQNSKKLQAICGVNIAGSVTEAHLQSPR